jgi:acyl-CoA synthetase (AMP-forming)/AMP-acid ligase II
METSATMSLLHNLTLGDVLRENRRSHPQKAALVCGTDRYTYPEMDDRANRLANALLADGVGRGDRVLWLGQNCHRVLEALLAAAKIGAVFCPVNWRQTAEELTFVVDDVDARVVIWQREEIGEAASGARDNATSKGRWLQHDAGGDGSYEAFLASGAPHDPDLDVDGAEPVLMLYTAAFAGRPNGALLSHTAITTQDMVIGMLQEITGDYVYLNSGPLFHIATFMTTLATFHFGGTNVFTRRVDAEELCRIIAAERCTGAFILPPTIDQMIAVNRDGKYDLKSLRTYAGKPEWTEMITIDTSPWSRHPGGYGQTEVMGMLTLSSWGGRVDGTHGRPSPMVQLRIVDPDGNEVPPGETGEIVARGPTVMTGYWNRDAVNDERQRSGWHHTNDLGRREPDGSITFVGPRTRIVKSAAENIYPAEVEGCIQKHPAVKEAAIIGVPDPKWTQSVKAVVVLEAGQTATADEIIEHCRAHIASYKKPRSVEFVEALPRDGWLVDYDALDARFGGGGYPGGRNRSA